VKWFAVALAVLALLAAGAWAGGALRWSALTRERLAALEAAREPVVPARIDFAALQPLPAPVQRYLRAVLTDGAPRVAALRIEHRGTFNLGESGEDWKPFDSRQEVTARRPGFVWDGRVAMAPGLPVRVHDAYVAGEGLLHPALLGLFDLGVLRGTGEVATGEAMRWLAEAAWYPTVLLPGQGVTWTAIDDRSARATLVDGAVSVSLTVSFGADGLLEGVRADARSRTVGGRLVPTPWEGRFGDYVERDGMRVPTTGEVAWVLADRRLPYWRGTVVSTEYAFAR
jgi:hypothetical protein